jgi:hypothetical protein
MTERPVHHDSFVLTFEAELSLERIEQSLQSLGELRHCEVSAMRPSVEERALNDLKFAECLPHSLAVHPLENRLSDEAGTKAILEQSVRVVVAD